MTRAAAGVVVLAVCVISAPRLRAQQLPIASFTAADGLADNWVLRIVHDSRGWLWFCTNEGLSRFDGYSFASFGVAQGLPDSRVNDLLESTPGQYLLATGAGLVRFDPRSIVFTTVPWPDLSRRPVTATKIRRGKDGGIWVGSDDGLFRLRVDGAREALVPVDIGLPADVHQRRIEAVIEDRGGNLWIGAPTGLYRRWPDGSFARYTMADGLPAEWIQDIYESRDGHLWAAARTHGFFRFTPRESRQPPVADRHFEDPELPFGWIWQIRETADGHFWVALPLGLLMFDSEAATASRKYQFYGPKNGIRELGGPALAEDTAANLWIGSWSAGALRLASNGLRTFGEREGLRSVDALFEDRTGRVCYRGLVVGDYDANLSVFEGAPVPLVGPKPSSGVARIGCFTNEGLVADAFWPQSIRGLDWLDSWARTDVTLQTRSGEWWVAAGNGLYHFPAGERLTSLRHAVPLALYSVPTGLSARQAFRLFEDSSGFVWISMIGEVGVSESSVARWDPARRVLQSFAGSPGLPSGAASVASAFGEDSVGDVWIGYDGALARYRRGEFRTFDRADGLAPGRIAAIYRDGHGTMWLASAKSGLLRMTAPDSNHPAFETFGTRQGLSSDNLNVIVDDLAGRIYAAGGRGIDRFDPATGNVAHLTTADGLSPGQVQAAIRDRHGVLWFGTISGLSRLPPGSAAFSRVGSGMDAPPVFITGVQVDQLSHAVSAIGETDVALAEMAPGRHGIQIRFTVLRFTPGEPLQYQYRLGGGAIEWSTTVADRSVTYVDLPPGRYQFEVRAVAPGGVISTTPARVSFSILRPMWQRSWFIALTVLILGLVARAAYRMRVARLLQVAGIRTRIASDLHDDIGANLTRIALLSDTAGPGAPDGRDQTIGRIARESVGAMSDIVWAIKPEREGLADLVRRMRQQADDLFVPRDIALQFQTSTDRADLRLNLDIRHDVLLFFKEAITNVARHSACTSVSVAFVIDRSQLTLTITDNGKGFDTSIEPDGQGLRGLRRRATRLGGRVTIASTPGSGTVVTLNAPL